MTHKHSRPFFSTTSGVTIAAYLYDSRKRADAPENADSGVQDAGAVSSPRAKPISTSTRRENLLLDTGSEGSDFRVPSSNRRTIESGEEQQNTQLKNDIVNELCAIAPEGASAEIESAQSCATSNVKSNLRDTAEQSCDVASKRVDNMGPPNSAETIAGRNERLHTKPQVGSAATTTKASSAAVSQAIAGSLSTGKRVMFTSSSQQKGSLPKKMRKEHIEDPYALGTLLWVKIGHYPHWPCMIKPREALFFVKDHDHQEPTDNERVVVHFSNDGRLAEVNKKHCLPFYEWKHLADYNTKLKELNVIKGKSGKSRSLTKKKNNEEFHHKVEMAFHQAIIIHNIYGNKYPHQDMHFEEDILD